MSLFKKKNKDNLYLSDKQPLNFIGKFNLD